MKRIDLQVYQKVIIVFAALVIPITAINIAINLNAVSYLRSKLLESTQDKVYYFRNQLNNQIAFIRKQHLNLLTDSNLVELNFRAGEMPKYEELLLTTRLQSNMLSIRNSNELVEDVAVHIESLNRMVSLSKGKRTYDASSKWEALRLLHMKNKQPYYLVDNQIYFIESTSNGTITTYVQLPIERLLQQIDNIIPKSGENGYFIADHRLQSAANFSGQASIQSDIMAEMRQLDEKRWQEGRFDLRIGDQHYLVIYSKINALGGILFTYMDGKAITGVISKYNGLVVVLAAAALIIIVVFSLSVNQMIHKPLHHLIRAFRKIELDPNQIATRSSIPSNEFNYLNKSFERMKQELNASIKQNYEHKLALQQSELKQLQSQINPHFLYNGFYNLYRMCRAEDMEGAAELSMRLANYYEFITRSGSDEVPLRLEYQHAVDYGEIQQIRFSRYIRMDIQAIPEALAELAVPRLVIQPIIENAFKHAFERGKTMETCLLRFEQKGDTLDIFVEDSGKTLADETIEQLNQKLQDPAAVTEKTGLINVCNRLKLRYGEDSGLKVSRSKLGGLCVCMSLPVNRAIKQLGGEENVPNPYRR